MKLKNAFWITACIAILAVIYLNTDPVALFSMSLPLFSLSFLLFFTSTVLWGAAWASLMPLPLRESLKLNTQALAALFSPLGLGGDFLRAYFARSHGVTGSKALAASFVVKLFKFAIMAVLIAASMYLIAPHVKQAYLWSLLSMIAVTVFGCLFVLAMRTERFSRWMHRLVKKDFVPRFRKELDAELKALTLKKASVILSWLLVSSLFEILAVYAAFLAVGVNLSLAHVFIFSAVAQSLALVTITPQGVGFVEAGGYLVLALPYFSLTNEIIGSFLIAWSLIRVWLPSLLGAVFSRWGN